MKYVIVGCGRFGAELALRFQRRNHDVVVVDATPAAFDNLHAEFRGRTVQGNALEADVLERAALRDADGLAAVTDSDCVNAVVARSSPCCSEILVCGSSWLSAARSTNPVSTAAAWPVSIQWMSSQFARSSSAVGTGGLCTEGALSALGPRAARSSAFGSPSRII